jgi:hypothetical protein
MELGWGPPDLPPPPPERVRPSADELQRIAIAEQEARQRQIEREREDDLRRAEQTALRAREQKELKEAREREERERADRAREREEARDHRIGEGHSERVNEARDERGLKEKLIDFSNEIIIQIAERVAFIVANHMAPVIGGHIVEGVVAVKNALDNIKNLNQSGAVELQIPIVVTGHGSFGLWAGPTFSGIDTGETAIGFDAGPAVGIFQPLEIGVPDVHVEEPEDEDEDGEKGQAAEAGKDKLADGPENSEPDADKAGCETPEPPELPEDPSSSALTWSPELFESTGPPELPRSSALGARWDGPVLTLSTDSDAHSGQHPSFDQVDAGGLGLGVAIYGSATPVAAQTGSLVLDADALLRYVRKRIFDAIYDGTPESVARAGRVYSAVAVVVFLDLDGGAGMWVDVDTEIRSAAATLFVKLDLMDSDRPIRFFRYEP